MIVLLVVLYINRVRRPSPLRLASFHSFLGRRNLCPSVCHRINRNQNSPLRLLIRFTLMVSEQQSSDRIIKAVLTPPLSLDVNDSSSSSSNGQNDYKTPNLLQRILSLFTNVRPGSDLTRLQLPPIFNFPKSQLQCFGESVYCINNGDDDNNTDLLSRCNKDTTPLERFKAVVAWNISTTRPLLFGVAPFNPILGETHHVSRGNLNVLLEQVSHHPPVTALHATDEKENLEMIWCHQTIAKFYGASVEAVVHGKRQLKLLNHGENYVMNVPNLLIRFFPVPGTDWAGNVTIQCEESGLEAELSFRGQSFLGFGGTSRSVKGRIINSLTKKTIYKVDGYWDRTVTLKDVEKGKSTTVIYNAKEAISRLKTPEVKDPKGLWTSESAVVWSEVSESILNKEWDKAREAKNAIEGREREFLRERKLKGETWVPKHFIVSNSKEGGWECSPHQKWVPPAPIAATY